MREVNAKNLRVLARDLYTELPDGSISYRPLACGDLVKRVDGAYCCCALGEAFEFFTGQSMLVDGYMYSPGDFPDSPAHLSTDFVVFRKKFNEVLQCIFRLPPVPANWHTATYRLSDANDSFVTELRRARGVATLLNSWAKELEERTKHGNKKRSR